MSVILLKITTFFVTLGAMLVYNFHKRVKGIKTKHNLKYGKVKNINKRFNVHFHKADFVKNAKHELRPIIIYFHGGGWTAYSKGIYTTLCKRLTDMGYVVFNVNYRLAPKTKMEGILADCVEAIMHIKQVASKYNGDASKIVLGGDSAGAHISSFIAAAITSDNFDENNIDELKNLKESSFYKDSFAAAKSELKRAVKGTLLFYGVYDITTMMTSQFPNIKTYAKATFYGQGNDPKENKVFSPLTYIDKNFPPCFIASGAIDKLHKSQSLVLKDRLEELQTNMQNLFFGKEELRAMHAFMIFDGLYTNEKALEKVKEFLKEIF